MRSCDLLALVLIVLTPAAPGLRTKKVEKNLELVTDEFPQDHRKRYALFKDRCTKCHSLERTIESLQTGITPVSGDSFEDADIKDYVIRMMRKRNSGISKEDALELTTFLTFARSLARGAPQPPPPTPVETKTSSSAEEKK